MYLHMICMCIYEYCRGVHQLKDRTVQFKHAPPGLGKVIPSPALMFSISTPCHQRRRQRQRQRQRTISQVIEQKKRRSWLPWLTITGDKDRMMMMITRSIRFSCVTLDHAFCDYLPSWKIKKKENKKNSQKKTQMNSVTPNSSSRYRSHSLKNPISKRRRKKGSQVATYIRSIVRKKEKKTCLLVWTSPSQNHSERTT